MSLKFCTTCNYSPKCTIYVSFLRYCYADMGTSTPAERFLGSKCNMHPDSLKNRPVGVSVGHGITITPKIVIKPGDKVTVSGANKE